MAAKKKRPRGRPRLPKGEDRGSVLTLRLTVAERESIEREATRAGQTVSQWARERLLAGR